MKRVLRISKEKGSVDNRAQLHEALDTWLDYASNGDYILRMDREVRTRSAKQNNLAWYWFGIMAHNWTEMCGYTVTSQDVHDAFCIELLPKETPIGVKVPGSTKRITEEQMSAFLESVRSIAHKCFGIYLPNDEDRKAVAYLSEYHLTTK